MKETKNELNTKEVVAQSNPDSVEALINDLGSKDGLVRMGARQALVTIGKIASGALVDALKSKDEGKRWEAAKALGQIGDPAAVGALIRALEDEIFDVRWLAAEGLIAIGKPALVPLLHMLIEHSDSVRLHEGAYHVLHALHEKNLKVMLQPLLNALGGNEASLEVPFAAETALKSLE